MQVSYIILSYIIPSTPLPSPKTLDTNYRVCGVAIQFPNPASNYIKNYCCFLLGMIIVAHETPTDDLRRAEDIYNIYIYIYIILHISACLAISEWCRGHERKDTRSW